MLWNLFKRPIERTSFESWAKMADDIAKVAILAVPAIFYANDVINVKLANIILLSVAIYLFLIGGRSFRQKFEEKK